MAVPIILALVAPIRRPVDPPHHDEQHPLGMANDGGLVGGARRHFITQSRPVRTLCRDGTIAVLDTHTKKLMNDTLCLLSFSHTMFLTLMHKP